LRATRRWPGQFEREDPEIETAADNPEEWERYRASPGFRYWNRRRGFRNLKEASMNKHIDITGQRYGRLVALKRVASRKGYGTLWLFRCDCGIEKEMPLGSVRSGDVLSCGCLRSERRLAAQLRQAWCEIALRTMAYTAWCRMKQLCTNPNSVCDRWRDNFENFYADVGDPPDDGLWLVRIDKEGNYEPTNVQWEISTMSITPAGRVRKRRRIPEMHD
jgi:hypothetical protein